VRGPLGGPVDADWLLVPGGLPRRLLEGPAGDLVEREAGPIAVIESARAAGRELLAAPTGDEPVRAGTEGVGDLISVAVEEGARCVLIGAGGTATTDGGWGALSAIGTKACLRGARLVVACDVSTRFRSAAGTFAPQKGATPSQVRALRTRLDGLAVRYRLSYGVDVDRLVGAGAGGGLAGGLAALGARLVGGFALIAALLDLDRRARAADLLLTGEGRVDTTSFDGKVVGGVLEAAGGMPPALCVAGEIEVGIERFWAWRPGPVDAVSLASLLGAARARRCPADAVCDVVEAVCRRQRNEAGRRSR
jgi:glycerate kinase